MNGPPFHHQGALRLNKVFQAEPRLGCELGESVDFRNVQAQGSALDPRSEIEEGDASAMLPALQPEDYRIPQQVGRVGMNRGAQNSFVHNLPSANRKALEVSHNESQLGLGDEHLDVRDLMLIQAILQGVSDLGAVIPAAAIEGIGRRRGRDRLNRLDSGQGILGLQGIRGRENACGKEDACRPFQQRME